MPGWQLDRTRIDDMHCTKLGLGHHVIGGSLVYFVSQRAYMYLGPAVLETLPPNASQQDILDDLSLRFKEWLKDHSLNYSIKRFTVKRLHRDTNSSYPFFNCKAAQTAPLVAWLADLMLQWTECCPPAEKETALITANMLWGLSRYFWICKNGGRFFTPVERNEIHESGHTFLFMYSELRRLSHEKGTFLWQFIPKFHQYHHLILDAVADGCNPRFFHCFGDEDQVGRMLKIARASHATTVVFNTVTLFWIGLVRRLSSLG